ncbi:Zinc finger and BTB domain-containing protein like [Argiope bruennichi]|uniref:Zinc finger and BTB domain-containing protein like n=1 Tax=Argiope bruennichi TaxID=94029 RepID=A0A8T0FYF7_ARGBR|nr:Zinc finger and BTB domain-containing protein like [Argiope bruennichi]
MPGYRRFENTNDQVPVEILPFLKQRPELTIFEKKPATPAPPPAPTRNVRYHCEFCPYESSSIQQFQAHLDNHKSTSAQQCHLCFKVFKNASKLQAHMYSHEPTRSHTCVYCEKKFKTPATLKAHMKSHFQFEQVKCAYCEKSFASESLLKRHIATYHMQ